MTYDNKKAEQERVDAWFNEKISTYTLELAMIEFLKIRGLKKLYLFDPPAELDIRKK